MFWRLFFAVGLVVSLSHSLVFAQDVEEEINLEIEAYRAEIERLNDVYLETIMAHKAQTEANLKLLVKKYAEEGKGDEARKIESAIEKLDARTSISNRVELRNDLIGKKFRWIKGRTIWQFRADGTIKSTTTKEDIFWVALNDFEVLTLIADGSLRILQFDDERENWKLKYIEKPKDGAGVGAEFIGRVRRDEP